MLTLKKQLRKQVKPQRTWLSTATSTHATRANMHIIPVFGNKSKSRRPQDNEQYVDPGVELVEECDLPVPPRRGRVWKMSKKFAQARRMFVEVPYDF